MKTTVCATLFTAASVLWTSTPAVHGDVVSAWSFNALDGESTTFQADTGAGTLDATSVAGGLGVYAGSQMNASDGIPAGLALGVRGSSMNDRHLELTFSQRGAVELSFAFRSTPSGFDENLIQALDGDQWVSLASFGSGLADGAWHQVSVVLPDSDGVGRVRLLLGGAESGSGTLRLDNLRISAISSPGTILACGGGCLGARSRRR